MRGPWLALCLLALLGAAPRPVDRVVALVDEDPILESDLERALQLGFAEALPGESREELRRRVLDRLIVQRLRYHEVDTEFALPVADEEIERQVELVRARWEAGGPRDQSFEAWLEERGLGMEDLRRLLVRQLRVLLYVEERLGPRVFVDLEEITDYYENVLKPELEAAGSPVPPLPEIREEIRALLREEGLEREIEEWTERLRAEADIVDRLESSEELPPVRQVVGPPVASGDDGGATPAERGP